MAQTVGTVLAKNMKLYIGATALTCQVDVSLAASTNMFETTCKDSGANAAFLPGTKSWTASGSANFADDATLGLNTTATGIFAKWDSQASIAMVFQTASTGDTKWSGTAYISSWTLNSSGNDEAVSYDFELQGTGALLQAVIS
jgi:Phage tail tube protein